MTPLKGVVMHLQNFFPSIGGAESQALTLSKLLVKNGLNVHVVTSHGPSSIRTETLDGVVVHRMGNHSAIFLIRSFIWLIQNRHRYQVIHVHVASSHALGACLAGKILKKKVIVKISGSKVVGEISVSRQSWLGRLKLRALSFFKPRVVVVSEEQASDFHGFGLETLSLTRIPNGVDLRIFHPVSPEEKNRLREVLGWEGLIFLFVGRFSDDKLRLDIFDNFLQAWKQAFSSRSDVSFFMVGAGALKQSYQLLIDQNALNGTIHLWDARPEVLQLYQAADCFVLPSISEGLSNALLEAMACGLAVLGSRVEGITSVLPEKAQQFLFDPLSPPQIKQALQLVLNEPELVRDSGHSNVKKASQYSIDESMNKILSLYQERW